MQKLKPLLRKIIRVRKRLIASGHSHKNTLRCAADMRRLEAWLDAYPNATEEQVKRWALQHADAFGHLCTSGAGNGDALIKQLNNQLYGNSTQNTQRHPGTPHAGARHMA